MKINSKTAAMLETATQTEPDTDSEIPFVRPAYLDKLSDSADKEIADADKAVADATADLEKSGIPTTEPTPETIAKAAEAADADAKKTPAEIKTMVKWTSRTITIKQFLALMAKTSSEIAFQRPLVWTDEQRSKLADSILSGYPLGMCIIWNGFNLDGKQRADAVKRIENGMFTVTGLSEDYEECNGKTFAFWSEDMRERFMTARIVILEIDKSATEDEAAEIFERINRGGRPLTLAQARRGKLNPKYAMFKSFVSDSVWTDTVTGKNEKSSPIHGKLGKPGIEDILTKVLSAQYSGNLGQNAKDVTSWLIGYNITSIAVDLMNKKLAKYAEILRLIVKQDTEGTVTSRIFKSKKLHIISILCAIDEKTDAQEAANNLFVFFQNTKGGNNARYNRYAEHAANDTASVTAATERLNIIREVIAE